MTTQQSLITIAIVALGTITTRFLPFLLFPAGKPLPKAVKYLSKVLPFSVMGLLVVYCLKNVSLVSYSYGLPEWISILCIVLLHLWKRSSLISIGAGTAIYMLLIQFVFV